MLPILVAALLVAPQDPGLATGDRYLRLRESDDGSKLHIEAAVRRLTHDEGPTVSLAAAIHISERSFYESLQARLDGLDVVLYESVKPPGTGDPAHDVGPGSEELNATVTRGRIRFLAIALHEYRELQGELPASLDQLASGLPADTALLVERSLADAWGRPFHFVAAPKKSRRAFDLQSFGADGRVGGRGANADLLFTDQDPLSDAERGEDDGFQKTLADALGLEFQLDVMDHTGENWRNSDLAMDQVEARLARLGASGDNLFDVIGGTDLVTKAAGFALELLTSFSYGNAAVQIIGIEILARADEMLEQAPPEMQDLLGVLLDDRNGVVVGDLRAIVESEPDVETVGVIYGAAHMKGLEEALVRELGYEVADEEWVAAITVDLDALGLSRARVESLRSLVRETLEGGLGGW